jgi:hypothetical protein
VDENTTFLSPNKAEGPGSISGTATMKPHGHIATRLFSTPSVPHETDSMASRGVAMPPQHTPDRAGGDHDHGTDHSFIDCYPSATHIQSTGTTAVSFLVDQDMVPLKIVQLLGI